LFGSDRAPGLVPVDLAMVQEKRSWFLGLGIAFLVLGALAIFLPFVASLMTTVTIGWLMLVAGLFQGYHAVQNHGWAGSGWAIVGAIFQLLTGLLVIAFPVAGTLTLTLVLAAFFAAEGVFKIIRAMQHRALPAWGWLLFDGLLALGLGVLIGLGWPSTAVWALGLLVGIDLLFGGSSLLLIWAAAGQRSQARS
jgi:uncharacterized membrane protein HdeD (DUF308 family)